MPTVFVTGGTGFMGRNLIVELLHRKFTVRALVRHGSEHKLPHGCEAVQGDALDKTVFRSDFACGDFRPTGRGDAPESVKER